MTGLLRALFWWMLRWGLHLRYRVEVRGLEKIRELDGPVLILPNHPAFTDPLLVLTHVRPKQGVRPIVTATMYRKPYFYPFMRLVNALEVPDLAELSHDARQRTLAMIDAVVEGLKRGENFVIYPAGRAERNGLEQIGATRAASEILQRVPHAKIVLVRTRGVWGSMFSYAPTGKAPELAKSMLRALVWLLSSLVLFLPRRKVTMTVEQIDRKDIPSLDRDPLNRFLEDWYNVDGPEQPTFVPYHMFLGPRHHEFPDFSASSHVELDRIKPETIKAVNEIIEERLGRPLSEEERQPQATLNQIGLDSLDRMDVALAIEDRFGFRSDKVASTLGDLWMLAEGLASESSGQTKPVPEVWRRTPSTKSVEVLAETLAEAFVRRALLHLDDVAIADRLSGALTYRKFLVGTRLMSKRLRQLPGDAVGVLLPASVAADLVFFSLHMAGKLPAMMNWTTGPANLAHAVEKLRIRHVVTSRKLIDRLGIQIEGAEYIFLEDLRSGIGKLEALGALILSYMFPRKFLADLPKPDPETPAVVLFTSGSESTPKAVPLSHHNLLSNVRASVKVLEATRDDAMLAFLPPFHSFGLMGGVIAPIVTGLRAVHHPDPTDAAGLVHAVADYRATLMVTTPTFLSYMFGVAKPGDLDSMRVIITGAEKCPESVFTRGKELAPHATILEGYGITECSPVVSGNRLHWIKPGTIGLPIEGVEVCVVEPESKQPLPRNTTGILLVRGPGIFHGYLDYKGPDPFVELSGKRWYNTGDLVELDDDGFIHFRGRLKRFLKAGGEMISLPALEEPFVQRFPPTEDGPQVAVEGVETPSGRWIALFSTRDISLREANAIVSDAGFRGVMRLDEVVRVDAIPVLGTGKTDYKVLRKTLLDKTQAAAASPVR